MKKLTLLLTCFALLALAPAASAHGGLKVVAEGLDNPRGIDIDPTTGAIYVAEAGRGGAGPCVDGPEGGRACLGNSGAVTRISHGHQRQVVRGLPSFAGEGTGAEATGPQDVDVAGFGFGTLVTGLGADPAERDAVGAPAAGLGRLFAFTPFGRVHRIADLAGFEGQADPDGQGADSNPTSVLNERHGFVAIDAGGNDLLRVGPRGNISTIAVFPNTPIADPPEGFPPAYQAVPTAVAKGPDGAYYVSELTGFPFPKGGADIYKVKPGRAPQVYASGLTNVTDLAFGRDGSLYVVQISKNGLLSGDPAGELIKIARNGTRKSVASDGLVEPYGVAIGRHGEIYVTNHSTSAGEGQVVRVG